MSVTLWSVGCHDRKAAQEENPSGVPPGILCALFVPWRLTSQAPSVGHGGGEDPCPAMGGPRCRRGGAQLLEAVQAFV